MSVGVFRVVSVLIACNFVVLAAACALVARPALRLRTMVPSTRRMAVVTLLVGAVFLVGSTYTNVRLLLVDAHNPQWTDVVSQVVRGIQGVTGTMLVLLARRFTITVYDRRTYERATFDPAGVEERLRYLALQEGLKV